MKAIRVHQTGGPEVLKYEEVPEPQPGPGQVRVRLEAIGINFIEVYHRTGLYPVTLPATPGGEAAGVVEQLGEGVTNLKVGDRVASQSFLGAYAEKALIAAARAILLPDGVTTKQGAAAMLQGMTAQYLATSTCPLKPGDWCLVHAAAGGVGLLLTQVAKKLGANVIGTVSTAAKARLSREAGADEVILYTQEDFQAETRRITDGKGVPVVYDSVGRTTFEKSLGCLATRGMLVLFGGSSGPAPPFDPQALSRMGSLYLTRPALHHYVAAEEDLHRRATDVLNWIQDGTLRLRIDRELPLAHAEEAHRLLESRATTGKLLLVP